MTWQPGDLVNLETARFTLRSMAREDVTDAFLSWLGDPEVMLGMNMTRQRLTRAQAVRFVLAHNNQTSFCLLVCDKNTGQAIGFFTVSIAATHRVAETSVVVGDREFWGKNVVREARSALLDFLFDELNMHKVIGKPHGRNFASIFNYKAMGFECEAVLREQMRSVDDDSRLDQLIFGMLKSRWLEKREETV